MPNILNGHGSTGITNTLKEDTLGNEKLYIPEVDTMTLMKIKNQI